MAKTILTLQQQNFLALLSQNQTLSKQFYFGGGTALTEYYLHHRESEDLDFFNENEFEVQGLTVFLKKIQPQLGFKNYDYQQSFNRNLFFLHFPQGYILKTEFTYFPFPRIDTSNKKNGINIDSLLDIAVNKLFTIYQNPRSRDYIDLYFIMQQKNWKIDALLKKAKIKFDWHVDPLQLGSQLTRIEELLKVDYPKMLRDINNEEVNNFFFQEAKKLEKQILE